MDLANSQLDKANDAFVANNYLKGQIKVKQRRAYLLTTEKKFEQAATLYLETLEELKAIEGHSNDELARSYQQLAYCYHNLEQYKKAVENAELAIKLYQPLKADHYEALYISHSNLVLSYSQLKMYILALNNQQQALEIAQTFFKKDRKRQAEKTIDVASAFEKVGDNKQAIKYYNATLKLLKLFKSEMQQDIAEIHFYLAQIAIDQDDYTNAQKGFELAVAYYANKDYSKANSNERDLSHLKTAYHNLAYLFGKQKRYQQAYDIEKK